MAENLDELRKHVFFEMLDLSGRVFVAVGYGDDVVIGKRGFLPQEKEKGIILVFNRKINFTWDDEGITATLVFGTTPEKCYIPQNRIMTIFSPELNAQFSTFPPKEAAAQDEQKEDEEKPSPDDKVIKVDFKKKKK
ncbi:MAG: hypothetical protein FIA94_00410 [Nitrospirae bacterium]|nr:hypothetical protein [Nitrospirota bacterium]